MPIANKIYHRLENYVHLIYITSWNVPTIKKTMLNIALLPSFPPSTHARPYTQKAGQQCNKYTVLTKNAVLCTKTIIRQKKRGKNWILTFERLQKKFMIGGTMSVFHLEISQTLIVPFPAFSSHIFLLLFIICSIYFDDVI